MHRCFLVASALLLLLRVVKAAFHFDITTGQQKHQKANSHLNYSFLQSHRLVKKNLHNNDNTHSKSYIHSDEKSTGTTRWKFPSIQESDLKFQEEMLQRELQELYIKTGKLKQVLALANKLESEFTEHQKHEISKKSEGKILKEASRIGAENAVKAEIQMKEMEAENKLLEDRIHRQEEAEEAEAMRQKSQIESKEKLLKAEENRNEMVEIANDIEEKAKDEAQEELEDDPNIEAALKEKEKVKTEAALVENAEEDAAASVIAEHKHQLARNAEKSALKQKEDTLSMTKDLQHEEETTAKENEEIENAWQQEKNKKIKELEDNEACAEAKAIKNYDKEMLKDYQPCTAKLHVKQEVAGKVPTLETKFENPQKFSLNRRTTLKNEQPTVVIIPAIYPKTNNHEAKNETTETLPLDEKKTEIAHTSIVEENIPEVIDSRKEKKKIPDVHAPAKEKQTVKVGNAPKEKSKVLEEDESIDTAQVPEEEDKFSDNVQVPEKENKFSHDVQAPEEENKFSHNVQAPEEENKFSHNVQAPEEEKKFSHDVEEPEEVQETTDDTAEPEGKLPKNEHTAEKKSHQSRQRNILDSPTALWIYMFVVFPLCVVVVLFSLIFFT